MKKETKEEILVALESIGIHIDTGNNPAKSRKTKPTNGHRRIDRKPSPSRIALILVEKGISPILDDEDLKAMHIENKEQWIRILKNEEPPCFSHPEPAKRNLEHIIKWLGVTMCDIYGMCMQTTNGGTKPCDCISEQSEKRWRK